MGTAIQLRVGIQQRTGLSPRIQQLIHLLTLPAGELSKEIDGFVQSNPLLEYSHYPSLPLKGAPAENTGNPIDSLPDHQANSLQTHLLQQIRLLAFDQRKQTIALAIIEAIDVNGYLPVTREQLLASINTVLSVHEPSVRRDEFESVRQQLSQLDPAGIASFNLQECLCSQLEQSHHSRATIQLSKHILREGMDLLAKQDTVGLSKRLHISRKNAAKGIALIRQLNPKPGSTFTKEPTEYIIPDMFAHQNNRQWQVTLNEAIYPRIHISEQYRALLKQGHGKDMFWIKSRLKDAQSLVLGLAMRNQTLLRIAQAIVRYQRTFLDYGPEGLRPLTQKGLAGKLNISQSTLSRAIADKYMHTPMGIYAMKYFFSPGIKTFNGEEISTVAIQAALTRLIKQEDPHHPISDNQLTYLLQGEGMNIARRTLSKYRKQLKIPPAFHRRRIAD